jgi:hypothetical protein
MAAVAFSPAAAQRIANAVRKVERTPTSMAGDRNRPDPQDQTFWAYLTSPGGNTGHWWSWVRVAPIEKAPNVTTGPVDFTETPPLWDFAEPMVAGYLTARESNGNLRVPTGAVVKLEFVGYDALDQPMYVFTYSGNDGQEQLRIHDHRDNLAGGFAFATYHPGTALPQQPWHV